MKRQTFLVAVLLSAGSTLAGPRDTATLTNMNSDGASPSNTVFVAAGTYKARFVRLQGTLTRVTAGSTYASEAVVALYPPGGVVAPMVFSTTATSTFTGSVAVDTFVRLPLVAAANGGWGVITRELVDDGPGPDSRWDTLTITLNDGPPATKNFGALWAGTVSRVQTLAPNQVHWYKFELQGDVSSFAGTYLDIDTEGSSVVAPGFLSDTVIALYDENGLVVGFDDDDGSGHLSQLTFGAGLRPAVNDGLMYTGRDGALAAGTYYLAVRAYLTGDQPSPGWDWPIAGSARTGPARVNIRTNVGTPEFCLADFNRDGGLTVGDIFAFLTAWFGGCP